MCVRWFIYFCFFSWYLADASRQSAENILMQEGKEGCFVVRNSTTELGKYTLSVFSKQYVFLTFSFYMHLLIMLIFFYFIFLTFNIARNLLLISIKDRTYIAHILFI